MDFVCYQVFGLKYLPILHLMALLLKPIGISPSIRQGIHMVPGSIERSEIGLNWWSQIIWKAQWSNDLFSLAKNGLDSQQQDFSFRMNLSSLL